MQKAVQELHEKGWVKETIQGQTESNDGDSEVLNLGGFGEINDKRDEEPRRKGEETFRQAEFEMLESH